VDETARALGESRERIVSALSYLADHGDLTLQPSGARHGYLCKDLTADERRALVQKLARQFAEREQRDLARLGRVLDYAQQPGCLTAYLLNYFGDKGITACGHCDRCHGQPPAPLPGEPPRTFGPADAALAAELRAECHAALATPRQLARFLCGLSSPAATRARLNRDPRFGRLAEWSFVDVLKWLTQPQSNHSPRR
jgi:ATP-dependent DNA helicase RecQ